MAFYFLPSLQHSAAVKVALTAYGDVIVTLLDELRIKEEDDEETIVIGSVKFDMWLSKRKQKASEKLSEFLPTSLEKRILCILQPIVIETNNWIRDHLFFIEQIEKSHYVNCLCWKSEGTIDRKETAKQLVQNESVDKRMRFVLACIYFLEHMVLQLWPSMTESERQSIPVKESNIAVRFWLDWLKENAKSNWPELTTEYFHWNSLKRMIYEWQHKEIGIRLSPFFIHLSQDLRKNLLMAWRLDCGHSDDFRQCFDLMDVEERDEVYLKRPRTGFLYLNWPLQSLFLDILDKLGSRLNAFMLEMFLLYILHEKLKKSADDFDYLQLFNGLWNRIPDTHKDVIKSGMNFTFVQAALSYDEKTDPRPLNEILTQCRQSTV